jgi:hypothetical protein
MGASVPYHSRDPLTGLIQSQIEDNVVPELQVTGQGNPVVWISYGPKSWADHCTRNPYMNTDVQDILFYC